MQQATIWMNPEDITLNETSQRQILHDSISNVFRKVKLIESKSRMVVAKGGRKGKIGNC